MRASDVVVLVDEPAPRLFRLRHVFAAIALWLAGSAVAPRVRAAWQLHTIATAFADYALCMAGPTAPSLLRDNPAAFRLLIRRRLVAAGADDRPFSRCARGARQVTESAEIERAHHTPAASFVEYGGGAGEGIAGAITLDAVSVTTR